MHSIKVVSVLSMLVPGIAYAQPPENKTPFDHEVAPARSAFELGVATGYSRGVGDIGANVNALDDLAGAGAAVELAAGYRIIPHLSIGGYGSFAMYQTGTSLESGNNVYSGTAGLQAVVHFRPSHSVDPWASLGGGWRGLWLVPDAAKNTSLQGFQLARLQLGVDYRVSRNIALAPVLGGSIDMFVQQDSPMTIGYSSIQDKRVNFTGFAGVSGRFDFGGSR